MQHKNLLERKAHLKGLSYVMFAILIWSGWVVVSRFGIKGTLSAYDITAIRFTTSGIILLPVVIKKGLRIGPWGVKSSLILSLLMGALYTNIAIFGMKFAPVSHVSTVINGVLLAVTTIVGMHGLREHIPVSRMVGMACSLSGIACMLLAHSSSGSEQWIGHLCFAIAGVMWASYALLVRAWKLDALHTAAIVCVFSLFTYMPFYFAFATSHIGISNWHEVVFQAMYQGVLTGIVALIAFNLGLKIIGAAHAGSLIPLVPAISTLMAIPILDEMPTLTEWLGVGAITIGAFISSGLINFSMPCKEKPQS